MNLHDIDPRTGLPKAQAILDKTVSKTFNDKLLINGRPLSMLVAEKNAIERRKGRPQNLLKSFRRAAARAQAREVYLRRVQAQREIEQLFREVGMSWRQVEKALNGNWNGIHILAKQVGVQC